MSRAQRRFDMTWYYVTMAIILLVICAPFLLVLAAMSIEGAQQSLGRLGELLMPGLPIGMAALAIWLVALIVHGVIWSRRQSNV